MANSEPVVIASDQSAIPISSATLATSAKQDTLLTELQLKADLTETQPVSLASVPSHAVTNAGTFAVQNTAATPAGSNVIGSVAITSNSLVSTANSSTANLAGAAVFIGTSEDVSEYATIAVSIFSSHVSATDGLSIQQSTDGTNWDFTDVYSIPAATGKSFSVPVQAKFYRLVYTNGATLTTSLRIQSIFSKEGKKGSSVRPQDARANDNDFEEIATYLNVYNGTTWDRARGDITNGVDVDVTRLPALTAGTAAIGKVQSQLPARVVRNFLFDTFTAAPVADTMQSVTQWYNNAAVAGTVSPAVVPAGKILRITSWGVETKSLATVGSVVLRMRANVAGTAVIGSPLVASISAGSIAGATTTAMTGAFCSTVQDFGPEGLEFPAATGIGFSLAGYGPTGVLTLQGVTRFWVYGYEYTA